MTQNLRPIGKNINYKNLWDKECMRIIIPKIQRDFAYGRENNEVNRNRFLRVIFQSIEPNSKDKIELDFIFGQKKKVGTYYEFYPLDGQQRLTILFLMHLYIGRRSGKNFPELDFLSQFSYETRDSSTEFCRRLVNIPGVEFEYSERYAGVVEYIKDQWWYNNETSFDPTISSMLTILNDIHAHFKSYDKSKMGQVWESLLANVSLWIITLDDLKATDDLYIKMNSRGKPLTSFEHFKALLDEYYGKSGEMSMKIDTDWTNLLWVYRKNHASEIERDATSDVYTENGLDERFKNLFYRFMIIEGAKAGVQVPYGRTNLTESDDVCDEEKSTYPVDGNYGKTDLLSLARVILGAVPDCLSRLSKILDFFCHIGDVGKFFDKFITKIYDEERVSMRDNAATDETRRSLDEYKVYIRLNDNQPTDFLKLATEEKMSMINVVILEAFFEYAYLMQTRNEMEYSQGLEAADEFMRSEMGTLNLDEDQFLNRLRIVRNLENNLQLHNYEMSDILKRVDRIVRCEDLWDGNIDDRFVDKQKDQELFKLQWKATHTPEEWRLLRELENSWFLYGNLHPLMPSTTSLPVSSLLDFRRIFNLNVNFDKVKKALLSFDDYCTIDGSIRKYGNSTWASWRDEIFVFRNTIFPRVFNAMIKRFNQNLDTFADGYLHACQKAKRFDWRYYLLKYRLIRQGRQGEADRGYFRIVTEPYEYLATMGGSRGRKWNPYLLVIQSKLPWTKLGSDEDWLDVGDKQIWIGNEDFTVIYENGLEQKFAIPRDALTGMDKVDRILYVCEFLYPSRIGRNSRTKLKRKHQKRTRRVDVDALHRAKCNYRR